jgi:hypothetical protein
LRFLAPFSQQPMRFSLRSENCAQVLLPPACIETSPHEPLDRRWCGQIRGSGDVGGALHRF